MGSHPELLHRVRRAFRAIEIYTRRTFRLELGQEQAERAGDLVRAAQIGGLLNRIDERWNAATQEFYAAATDLQISAAQVR
jgi:hypothetical protein